jgi:hypothetical protein
MFSRIAKIDFRIAILRSSMGRGLVVYTFALGIPKGSNGGQRDQANVQAMEARHAME